MVERLRIPGVGYAWIIAGILWLWTFWACAGEWLNTEAYSYGVFVPLLAGYFFWRRWREMEPAEPSEPEARCGWVLLWILVFCAAPLELLRQTPLYWRPILWMMGAEAAAATLVAAFLTGGWKAVRGMSFPACFSLMGIPWPGLVETATTLVLQGWVALATGEILNWLGVAAVVEGKIIRVTQCVLGVEEACSGLQGLQSSLMVALAGGEVFRRGVRTRLALVAWGVGVALAGNLLRAVILGLIGARSGPERVEHWHNLLGGNPAGGGLGGLEDGCSRKQGCPFRRACEPGLLPACLGHTGGDHRPGMVVGLRHPCATVVRTATGIGAGIPVGACSWRDKGAGSA